MRFVKHWGGWLMFLGVGCMAFAAQAVAAEWSDEAVRRAMNDFTRHRVKCGDAWYLRFDVHPPTGGFAGPLGAPKHGSFDNYMQMQDVGYRLHPQRLTPAQTLNGIQWKGAVTFHVKVYRFYDATGMLSRQQGWSPWRDGGVVSNYYLTLQDGRWNIQSSDASPLALYGSRLETSRANCEEISRLQAAARDTDATGKRDTAPPQRCMPWESWDESTRQCKRWRANPYGR